MTNNGKPKGEGAVEPPDAPEAEKREYVKAPAPKKKIGEFVDWQKCQCRVLGYVTNPETGELFYFLDRVTHVDKAAAHKIEG